MQEWGFDQSGRATCDVSGPGAVRMVINNGDLALVGGTSLSSPYFCGQVSIVNWLRKNLNYHPVGSLTPMLYSKKMRKVFQNRVQGSNDNMIFPGFKTVHGCNNVWDPCQGLGVFLMENFVKALVPHKSLCINKIGYRCNHEKYEGKNKYILGPMVNKRVHKIGN